MTGAGGSGRIRKLRQGAELALTRGLEAGVRILPLAASGLVASSAATLAYRGLRVRRAVAEGNLRTAFPDRPRAWIRATAAASYAHLARESLATVRLSHLPSERIRAITEFSGWGAVERAHAEGRGVILLTGHFGNWEMGAAAVAARGLPMDAIVRRQSNERVDARFAAMRHRFGVGTIDAGAANRAVIRSLRAGNVVGIVGDQDARQAGVWVRFFGRWTSTYRGAAVFALRLGTPVFFCACRRLPGRRPRYAVETQPLGVRRTGDAEADARALTQSYSRALEASIRRDPEQYFWVHRRWKSRPPPELPPLPAGTSVEQETNGPIHNL